MDHNHTVRVAVFGTLAQHLPIPKEYRHTVKSILMILILMASSGAAGTSIAAHVNLRMKPAHTEGVVLAAMGYQRHRPPTASTTPAYSQYNPDAMDASILATHSAEITNTESDVAKNATAIANLNGKINDMAMKSAIDNERLGARIDNDETKLTTAIAVIGSIMSIGMGILLFFHFDERFKRRKLAEETV